VDHQVKVRGNRIELGEVEATLEGHEAVREAIVTARKTPSGEQQLVAYVVLEKEAGEKVNGQVTDMELRKYVWERLPQYMVPAVFVKLDEMPLSKNGKIDRRRLPEVEKGEGEGTFAAPTNPIEESLAAIWTQVLRTDSVSIDDNFFALGGDSIRIVQVVSQAQQKGLNFEAQLIYQHQTIRELARELEKTAGERETLEVEPSEEEEMESLAELMEMLEGLSEDDVKVKIGEKLKTTVEGN
jgi:aryl carrier-like protein